MRGRFPQFKPPPPARTPEKAAEKSKASNDVNALWRVPSWYPHLAPQVLELLKRYHGELVKFNARLNLVSRNTERECDELHFADSILAAEILLKQDLGKAVYDVGSGNGFPGLVMALLDPIRNYFLVESDVRKSEFLKHAIHLLAIKNATVMNVRFDSLRDTGVEVAVSRGFAPISKAVLACNKVIGKSGRYFHLKGNTWSSEIADLPSQLISVWRPNLIAEYTLPVNQARHAIVLTQKIQ